MYAHIFKGAPFGNKNAAGPRKGYGPANRSDVGRSPLKGHAYHGKTDAELKYIIQDAGEAAAANKGGASEAKYLDQVNDASTVLHHRKSKP